MPVAPRSAPRSAPGRSPGVEAALARALFVIPSINGGALLRRMLPTLHLPPHTVVVLDQGSIDDTEAVCAAAGVRLVQLGRPHTYTEAGNIGARMAREAGCDFLFLSNNDIAFTTDVGAELLAEMLEDPHLGIVAPSQVIVDEKTGQRVLAYRAEWHLDTMLFTHDVRALPDDVARLEADLCELTCAAVRMTAIAEIGFLDDDFGFYYEDADFCFRLRQAGYSCAYLPRSQIEHFTSSTFSAGLSGRKRAFMAKNVELFAGKHLGYGVGRLIQPRATRVDAWTPTQAARSGAERHLSCYLQRFGLIDRGRPGLVHGSQGTRPLDYLYTDWTDDAPTDPVRDRLSAYRGLVATTEWGRQRLQEAGLDAVGFAPVGVETDIFHPWAALARPFDEPTLLWSGSGGDAAGLSTLLDAWRSIRAERPRARLIVIGPGVSSCLRQAPVGIRRWHDQTIADFPDDGISLRDTTAPLPDEDWARLCRGVDVIVSTDLHPAPALAAAMACGTLGVFTSAGSGRNLAYPGALVFGAEVDGAAAVWRPELDSLVDCLRRALTLSDGERHDLARRALPLIRSRLTWRNTCAGLNAALAEWQQPARIGTALRRRWEHDMDLLTGAGSEVVYDAVAVAPGPDPETAPVPVCRPVPAPAAARGGSTAAEDARTPGSDDPQLSPRLVRGVRRAWRGGWAIAALRRREGSRAAAAVLRGSLSRHTRLQLRGLLIRSGLMPHRD